MRDIYIPAYTGAYNLDFVEDDELILSENSKIKHPYLLISAGHNLNLDIKKYNIDLKKNLILGDSGGYQIATDKVKYSDHLRKKIFDWLENNTNYAMNLDSPPYAYKNSDYKLSFEDALEISYKNFDYFYHNQSGKTKFLNVIHGQNIDDNEKWYSRVKDFNFSGGWSIGSVVGTYNALFSILLSFSILYQNGEIDKFNTESILHILGFSKVREIIHIQYLVQKLREKSYDFMVTYDSSSPGNLATRLQYVIDYSMFSGTKTITLKRGEIDINLCSCPICRKRKISELIKYNNDVSYSVSSSSYVKIYLHNLHHLLNSFARTRHMTKNMQISQLKSILPTNDGFILECIEKMVENKNSAIETLYDHYDVFKTKETQKESTSIDNFF